MARTVLQIVPRVPGGIDGVGDYALTISRKLRDEFGCETTFAAFDAASAENVTGFDVVPLETLPDDLAPKFDNILLHYVNYGFQNRGVPFRLMSILRTLRKQHRGKFVTIFHEIYASGAPWQSAFWLRPLQIHLAKRVAQLSDSCIVSSDNSLRDVKRLVPGARVELHPVLALDEALDSPFEIDHLTPEQAALDQEALDVLRGRLALLPELQQQVLRLRFAEGLSCAQIAARLGKSEGAVRTMLSRTLQLLRSIYREREVSQS